jgi:hypothetical protein
MIQELVLRDVVEDDLPLFFEFQLDPNANYMAAFIARDPADRKAFTAHWNKIMVEPTCIIRTIVCEGQVVGSVSSYEESGKPEVTYWIGRGHWGKGIATRALDKGLRHDQCLWRMNLVRHEEMRRINAKMRRHPAPVFGNRVRIVLRADAAVKRCVNSLGVAAQPGEKSMCKARGVEDVCEQLCRRYLMLRSTGSQMLAGGAVSSR